MVSMDARCDRSAATLTTSTAELDRRRSRVSFGSIRSCTTILAPAPARLSATASPRPAVAPVTRAHLPFNIGCESPLVLGPERLGQRQLRREYRDRHSGLPLHNVHAGADAATLFVELDLAERIVFRGAGVHRTQRFAHRNPVSLPGLFERVLDHPH